ncbi:MAG TPA: hypothetical protein VLE94_13135 [Burkholderiaceae bacterium]|nr:hypothetical protein [Burkholderiaceae bacterium]
MTAGPWVAFWPHTPDERVASARLRCWHVVRGLRELGVDARIHRPGDAAPRTLVLSKRYDPESLAHADVLRRLRGTRLLLDLCDNHFHNDHPTPLFEERARQLARAVRQVDHLVAASTALVAVIREHVPESPRIDVIGDLVEERLQPPRRWRERMAGRWQLMRLRRALAHSRAANGRRLVWFGNHGSPNVDGGMQDLESIRESLWRHHRDRPLSLTVISNSAEHYSRVSASWPFAHAYLPWSSANFDAALALHDVALIPITPNPFTRCKTANRVATASVHGVAVVADTIPSYEEFRGCIVLDDWGDGLARLMDEPLQRQASVAAARRLLQQRYAPAVICARWRDVLQQGSGSPP